MRINPNSEVPAVLSNPIRTTAPEPRLGQDQAALAATESINQSLGQIPDVRDNKVAEAKALIQDGSYPPEVIIRKISALLAIKIDPKNNSE